MKIKTLTVFVALIALVGCTSTAEKSQTAAASVESHTNAEQKLTSKELEHLAKNTNFTPAELKAAAKKLGYKCSFFAVTGSRIKQKVCSTKQQRDVRAEAAKHYLRNIQSPNIAPKG